MFGNRRMVDDRHALGGQRGTHLGDESGVVEDQAVDAGADRA